MKIKSIQALRLASVVLLTLSFANSCKKTPAPPGAHDGGTKSARLICEKKAADALANQSAPKMNLADLTVGENALSVSNQSLSSTSGVSGIQVDFSQIGSGGTHLAAQDIDISAAFMIWKACSDDGKQCTNNGNWTKTYSFNVSNITDMPIGTNSVSVKICVSDLLFLNEADRSNAVNDCETSAPCYCGKEVSIRTMNSANAAALDSSFKAAADALSSAKKEMLKIAQDYVNRATSYWTQCSVSDNGSAASQYARNISEMPPTSIALNAEQLASVMNQYVQLAAQSQGSNLQLADSSMDQCIQEQMAAGAPVPGAQQTVYTTAETPVDQPVPAYQPYVAPKAPTPVSTGTVVDANSGTTTNADTNVTAVTSTSTGLSKGAKGAIIGIGVGLLAVGAYIFYHGLSMNKGWPNLSDAVAKAKTLLPGAKPSPTKPETLDSLHAKVLHADKALAGYERDWIQAGVTGDATAYDNAVKRWNLVADSKTELLGKQKALSSTIDDSGWKLEREGAARSFEDSKLSATRTRWDPESVTGHLQVNDEIYKRRIAEADARLKKAKAGLEPIDGEPTSSTGKKPLVTDDPAAGSKPKSNKAGNIMMGVGVLVSIAGGAVIAGGAMGLADGACGNFMATAQEMEGKLLYQQSVIEAADANLTKALTATLGK